MEDLPLIERMKKREIAAYEEWLTLHAENLMRFAFQYGCSMEEAAHVAERAFKQLFTKIDDSIEEEQFFYMMYQRIIQQLGDAEIVETEAFVFEEDAALHHKIIRLEKQQKLILLLSTFQSLEQSQIAMITGVLQEEIPLLIAEALQALGESQVEKKCAFLKKSYERLTFQFDEATVLQNLFESGPAVIEKKPPIPKKTWISLLAGGLILVTLLIFSVVNSADYQEASAQKYIEKMKQDFEGKLKNVQAELGFGDALFKEMRAEQESGYEGTQVQTRFDVLIDKVEMELANEGKIDKDKASLSFAEIIADLQTPTEMVEGIMKNPLSNDLAASQQFFQKYFQKHFILRDYYFRKLYAYSISQSDLSDYVQGKEGSIDRIPEDLRQSIAAMEKQNMYLTLDESGSVYPYFQKNEYSETLRTVLHEDLSGYITMLEYIYSLEEWSIDDLLDMEKSLLTDEIGIEEHSLAHSMLVGVYAAVLLDILGVEEQHKVFGKDGKVKEEIRAEWENIANMGDNSPAAYVMRKLIEEMKETDWAYSKMYIYFYGLEMYEMINYAARGDLHSFDMTVEDLADLSHNQFSQINLSANIAFEHLIAATYEQFLKAYDVTQLEGTHPITIFGLYHYANEQKNPEMMWHLRSRREDAPSLETYIANWQREDLSLGGVSHLSFDAWDKKISYTQGDVYDNYVQMAFEENRWLIEKTETE